MVNTFLRNDATFAQVSTADISGTITDARLFDSRAAAAAAIIPNVNWIYVAGYSSAGDGGDALFFKRSAPGSPQAWHFQSADGAWWQLASDLVRPEHFGAKGDNSTNDSAAVQIWINYAAAGQSGKCQLSGKIYYCPNQLVVDGTGSTLLFGFGDFSLFGVGPLSVLRLEDAPGMIIRNVNSPDTGINCLKLADMQLYSSLNSNTILETRDLFGLFNLDSVHFNGGNIGLHLNSETGPAKDGSLSAHLRGCEFNNQNQFGLWGSPAAANLVENIHILDCEFFDQNGWSIWLSDCDAVWIGHIRCERDTFLGRVNGLIHIDGSFQVRIFNSYLENSENYQNIEIGSNVSEVFIDYNYISCLVAGGSHANGGALNATANIDQLSFNYNHVVFGGNAATGRVFSATVTKLDRHNNTVQINAGFTVTNGWFDGGAAANMASYGNSLGTGGGTLTNPVTFAEPVFYGFTFP